MAMTCRLVHHNRWLPLQQGQQQQQRTPTAGHTAAGQLPNGADNVHAQLRERERPCLLD